MNLLNHYRKTLSLLDPKTKRVGLAASILLSLTTLLDLAGLGLILPIAGLMSGNRSFLDHTELKSFESFFQGISPVEIAGYLAVLLVVVLILKTIFTVSVLFWVNKMFLLAEARFTARLYTAYLNAPLDYHYEHNSAEILRDLNQSCPHLFRTTSMNTIKSISEITLSVGVILLLIVAEPLAALACLLVLSFGGYFYLTLFSKPTTRWAKTTHGLSLLFHKTVRESLDCLIDVKTLDKSNYFVAEFMSARLKQARVTYQQLTVFSLPRYVLELLMGILMASIIIIMIAIDKPGDEAIAILALYALAAMRLMPVINRLIMTLDQARVSMPAVSKLYEDVWLLDPNIVADMPWMPGSKIDTDQRTVVSMKSDLEIKKISYHYSNGDPVLKDISLLIKKGESIGIVGPSGSGKTTLANIILGLLEPTGGEILMDGKIISGDTPSIQRSIGYVPQHIAIRDDSIKNNIAFGVSSDKANEILVLESVKKAQLEEFISTLPGGLNSPVGENGSHLSGGQMQRLGIARALYNNPEILILDEATSALDVGTEAKFSEVINDLQGVKTLLIIAHRLSTIKNCDRIVFLNEGRIIAVDTFDVLNRICPGFQELVQQSDLGYLP